MFGRHGWANGNSPDFSAQTGFERELPKLLHFLDEADVRGENGQTRSGSVLDLSPQ